jgi:hypothetical protein
VSGWLFLDAGAVAIGSGFMTLFAIYSIFYLAGLQTTFIRA